MRKKILFALSIVALIVFLAACASPTPPPPVKETVPVPQTVIVQQTVPVPQTVVVQVTPTAPAKVQAPPGTLISVPVKNPPAMDGSASDAAWANAPATEVAAQTFGLPGFKVTFKSVYDDANVYVLIQYPDSNMEANRGEWAFDAAQKAWAVISDDFGDEDEFGFFWNYNIPNYSTAGCTQTCHGDQMFAPPGTWADEWQWTSVRTNPLGWAFDKRLTDDASADDSGGFAADEGADTNPGLKDNTQKLGALDVPLYWKPFSGAGGVSIGDPRALLQSEIDAGIAKKIVKIGVDGTLVDEAGNKVPLWARIPGWILSAPGGPSYNDVKAKGVWLNGVWTVELMRKLNTGHNDDVQFDTTKGYYFDMYIKTREPGETAHAQVPVTRFVFAGDNGQVLATGDMVGPTPVGGTTTATPPALPADHAGRTTCKTCHDTGVGGAPKLPADHAGRDDGTCTACHKPQS
jgi:Ethylbenzene dehydrogenase/Carbohydrate family 9 binding domain-like